MKIIFLDFDGVLNSGPFLRANSAAWEQDLGEAEALDPAAVARLNRLVRETGAAVVVSSSWRHGRSLPKLKKLLRARGFVGNVRDKTPDFVPIEANAGMLVQCAYGQRGDEIKAWLYAHAPVEAYVVLDDNGDMDAVRDRFVQTDMDTGLTDEHVDRAVLLLGRT